MAVDAYRECRIIVARMLALAAVLDLYEAHFGAPIPAANLADRPSRAGALRAKASKASRLLNDPSLAEGDGVYDQLLFDLRAEDKANSALWWTLSHALPTLLPDVIAWVEEI
jgi:hypothetical protein